MRKKLCLAQIAPSEERVPPPKYGGTELVVSNLTEELIKRGHQVTLLASGDSITKARLVPIFKKAVRTDADIGANLLKRDAARLIGTAQIINFLQQHKFDIIHNHIDSCFLPFISLLNSTPVITTVHGSLDTDYQQFVYNTVSDKNYVSISNNQRRPMPQLNFLNTIYHGIQIDKFDFNSKKGKYVAFLGRMSPEKGPLQTIRAAKKAKIPLIMAAKVDLVDKEYFNKKIKPLIDGKSVKFIGEVDHRNKVKLLRNAAALLCLIQWEEPFGLVMIEALACGTPVIANKRGSVPEIIQNGKTGFIVKNISGAVKAIHNIDQINRSDCRKSAEEKFSVERMAEEYEKIYYKLLKKKHG